MAKAAARPLGSASKASGAMAWPLLAAFSSTMLLSALLLFALQPLFAKMVLPRLGGTPAVWSVAMVFFQGVLLAGYAYAHALVRFAGRLGPVIHTAVMTGALLWLPIGVAAGFEMPPESGMSLWLLALFAASVGVPFFAVSANAPLLQAWFSRTGHPHAHDPYFLYGASNIGSFCALLSYPVLFEPLLTLAEQSRLWTAGYAVLFAAVAACGWKVARTPPKTERAGPDIAHAAAAPVTGRVRLEWIGFAFVPSALLVAVTAHLSTNIAAAPFLWVMPLAAFLLTFVVAFQRQPILPVRAVQLMLPVAVLAALLTYMLPGELGGLLGIAINLFAFFVIALAWHCELVARRPAAASLTDFYVCMSAGGVLGGAFTSLAAPVLFDAVTEFPLLLLLSLLAVPEMRGLLRRSKPMAGLAAAAVAILANAGSFTNVEHQDRSFFGVVATQIKDDGRVRTLKHGTTIHGAERIAGAGDAAAAGRPEPLTYFAEDGPLAQGIMQERRKRGGAAMSVAVVGLGAGSLACYSAPGDLWRFFEIDPAVIRIAADPRYFSFLSSCTPDAAIVQGDARLMLAHEPDRAFDVLVIDAFSSDAIPVHLLTREALRLYVDKVRPDGVVLLHISNRFMDLASIVAATAAAEGLPAARRLHVRPERELTERLRASSDVAVLSADPELLTDYIEAGWRPLLPAPSVSAWTDDFSNVVAAILRKQGLL